MPLEGEHKPLPMRARSQGNGSAPHQHPQALLGQGGSQGTGSQTHHATQSTDVLGPASIAWTNTHTSNAAGARKAPEPCLPPSLSLVQAGSAVCLQAVPREGFLEGHLIISIRVTSHLCKPKQSCQLISPILKPWQKAPLQS